jgi:hypothetical protein
MAEAVAEVPATTQPPARTNTVVTQENMHEWVDQQLGLTPGDKDGVDGGQSTDTIKGASGDEVTAAQKELDALKPAPKEGDKEGSKVYFNGKWVDKHNFDYRLHVKTQEKTKEIEDAKTATEARLKSERDRAEAAIREAAELRAKYEPAKTDELGPEPQPEQFANPTEYGKALKDWTADATRREEAQKVRQAEHSKAWNQRTEEARKEIADFDAVIKEGANILLSPPVTEAVLDSEVGPKILHHLAKNPEVADALNKMPAGRAQREIGKLEASFVADKSKPAAADPAKPAATVAEVSRAPAPISPIKGGAGVVTLKGSDPVPSNWTYEDYKAARASGKIK